MAAYDEPLPDWYGESLHWHSEEFLRVLDEVHGPLGAAEWGGAPYVQAMCRHLFEKPDELEFKRLVGYTPE